jgi:hypothetical protein
MIPQNSNWNERKQVIKGDFAEDIINKFLEEKGYVVYNTTTKGAHVFDKLAIKNKEEVIIAECKAKARRNNYEDTGIDYRHYLEYKNIQDKHKIPVFIFFIDEMMGKIYGNFITLLIVKSFIANKEYPSIELTKKGKKIIYFPLCNMRDISTLRDEQVKFLKENSTRSHEYRMK